MENIGKIFKLIRETKKMSLKEVAGNFVTPAQLSRFENGKSNLSVDTFFYCLKRMNISEGEFMDINFELYKVFYYVATSLSFSEASKKLFISQSAVSQSIKTLEKRLNQNLFIRSTKKVRLTPEGEILLRHIEPAINLI